MSIYSYEQLSTSSADSGRSCTQIEELAKHLKVVLHQELIASDAFISMFVSALKENKDYCIGAEEIMDLINETPNLFRVLTELKTYDHKATFLLEAAKIEWLHWLIAEGLTLRMLNSVEYVQLMSSLDRPQRIKPKPLHIFEIKFSELKHTQKMKSAEIRYGFYVGHFSEFYTIVKNGFNAYSCKENNSSGRKLRLLPDLASAFNCLEYDAAWNGSICGTEVACIALCSYVNDLKRVCIECSALTDSTIIEDSDLVVPHFILFYGNRGAHSQVVCEPLQSTNSGLLQMSPSMQRILSFSKAFAWKNDIQKNLTKRAIVALGHLVVPICNQILS